MHVAIIGAGFSGMLTAYLLEKQNIKVTIFEKEEFIGGHCKTITSKNTFFELGTICLFTNRIKALLIELNIKYTESFIYINFVDKNHKSTEHMSQQEVKKLMLELKELEKKLLDYSESLKNINFGIIHEDLMMTFKEFTNKFNFISLRKFIKPFLASFGFGHVDSIQTYYIFKIFNLNVINSYLQGNKLLFINKGTSELIDKLSSNISDIRYSLEVNNIEKVDNKVKVETPYSSDLFDKVLITTKLPKDVINDKLYNSLMKKIETNPFIACAYEITDCDSVTTYFKENHGILGKIQFFHIAKHNNNTTLVAYAYGREEKKIIDGITADIKSLGINILHLITVKQWFMFPHLKEQNLTTNFYDEINEHQKDSNICLIGSLVSIPSIDNLYSSVKKSVNEIIRQDRLIKK